MTTILPVNYRWIGLAAILIILFASTAGIQSCNVAKYREVAAAALQKASDDQARVKVANDARDAAQVQADAWKGQAENALTKVKAKDAEIAKLQARLAGLKPQAVPAGAAPKDAKPLAEAYTAQGFPPTEVGPTMGWPLDAASLMLPLLMDGKNYPSALERISLLGQEVTLHEQKEVSLLDGVTAQTKRADNLEVALTEAKAGEAAAQDVVTDLNAAVKAKDKVIGSEKRGKAIWGTAGAVLGFLAKWALVAL
jgi:hypothetical protein